MTRAPLLRHLPVAAGLVPATGQGHSGASPVPSFWSCSILGCRWQGAAPGCCGGANPRGNQQQGLQVLPEQVAVLCRCKPLKQESKSCGLFIFGMFFGNRARRQVLYPKKPLRSAAPQGAWAARRLLAQHCQCIAGPRRLGVVVPMSKGLFPDGLQ